MWYPAGGYVGLYGWAVEPPVVIVSPVVCINVETTIDRGEDFDAVVVRGLDTLVALEPRGLDVQVTIAGVRCAVQTR